METYFNYIIESGISLGVFTLVYWLLLRKEVLLNASRIYLLVAILFSTLLPFISINLNSIKVNEASMQTAENVVLETNMLETITVYTAGLPAKMGQKLVSVKPSVWFYTVGTLLALFFILYGLGQLFSMISHNRRFKLKWAQLVITRKPISPYSFFNFIFISRDLPEQENWKAMVHHELEHVRQGHSFDVLFVDFMMVFQWFNPFYWIIRKWVRENHEFMADRAVLRRGKITAGNYKALLLSQAIGGRPVMTSNFFSVKTIQKRFKMITTNKTGKYSFLKYALGVVAALSISMSFAVNNTSLPDTREVVVKSPEPKETQEVTKPDATNSEIAVAAQTSVSPQKPDERIAEPVVKEEAVPQKKVTSKADYITGWQVWVTPEEFMKIHPEIEEGSLPKEKGKIMLFLEENNSEDMEIARKLNIKLDPKDKITNVKIDAEQSLGDDVFVVVEDMPEFPGGELALRKWIANNVKYPVTAAENGIQGKVYVMFVVEKDGSIGRSKIARGVDPSLDQEALRVINAMPKWKPGKQKGKEVPVSYTVPINFQLDNGKEIDETVVVGYGDENTSSQDTVYTTCDVMPEFEGGELGARKFIANNIRYPKEAQKYKEQGKVFVTFVVAKDGAVEKVRVARSVSPSLDNEAVRVVSTMPNWTPGMIKGKPVNVQFTMPVSFKLQ